MRTLEQAKRKADELAEEKAGNISTIKALNLERFRLGDHIDFDGHEVSNARVNQYSPHQCLV